jgi:hypothetical protein
MLRNPSGRWLSGPFKATWGAPIYRKFHFQVNVQKLVKLVARVRLNQFKKPCLLLKFCIAMGTIFGRKRGFKGSSLACGVKELNMDRQECNLCGWE